MAKQEHTLGAAVVGTRPCPSCGIATDKVSGCNHMTCSACRADWCWICGKCLDGVIWHYSPANPAGCQQFQDDDDVDGRSRLMRCLKICMCPVAVVSVMLAVVCLVASNFSALALFALSSPFMACGANTVGADKRGLQEREAWVRVPLGAREG